MRKLSRDGLRLFYEIVREPGTEVEAFVNSSGSAAKLFKVLQGSFRIPNEREAFVVFAMDSRNNMIGLHVVSIGSVNSSIVHPREVFRFAVGIGATSIVLLHNHPSGDCRPSKEDERVTERLKDAGGIMGIQVLDHLIVGKDRYYSFEEGCSNSIEKD